MLIALDENKAYTPAQQADGQQIYRCPGCREVVHLRQGDIKQPHFAHQAGAACQTFTENESPQHLAGKLQLATYCQQFGTVFLEAVLPEIQQRPDLLLVRGTERLAIEYQCSPITQKRLDARNAGYRQHNISVVWVLGPTYYHRQLAQRTILKFLTKVGLTFYLPDTQQFIQRAQFEKIDFGRLTYVEQSSPQWLNHELPGKPHAIDLVKQIYKLQQLVLQQRVDKQLIAYLYQQERLLLQAPLWIHQGRTFGLTISNWQWRLQCLLFLEKVGVGHVSQQQHFVNKFKRYVLGSAEFQSQQVRGLLVELEQQAFIQLKGAYLLVTALPVWYGSLQQKLGQVRK